MTSKPDLRFVIGDRVKCNMGSWNAGTVVALWWRGDNWPKEKPSAPYQVKLDDGTLIFAPKDTNEFIKKFIPKIPVTVLTGFLGAGKTTLLNHILKEKHGLKIGIIENEFGAVSIDDKLLKENSAKRGGDEIIIEMKNGCICCTVRKDLATAFKDILGEDGERKLDAVIVETTGMADPAPIIQTFVMDEFCQERYELDAVLTVVDAKHVGMHLDDKPEEGKDNQAVSQIAFGDRILLNKIDLVNAAEKKEVLGRVRAINSTAAILESTLKTTVPSLDLLLGLQAFDPNNILKEDPTFFDKKEDSEDEHEDCGDDCEEEGHGHSHGHGHGHGHDHDHADGDKKKKKPKAHRHDSRVNTISLQYTQPVDIHRLNEWVGNLLKVHSADIFRMKGILNIKDSPKKFVFQGVHMFFDARPSEPWKDDEKRESVLVFIGRKMKSKEDQFRKDFEKCLTKAT